MAFFETVLIPRRYIFKAASAFIETKPRASELENFLNKSFVESISFVLKKFGISGFGSIIRSCVPENLSSFRTKLIKISNALESINWLKFFFSDCYVII